MRVARDAEQHKKAGRYREALQEIAGLRQDVDDFFDGVMVMAEQEQVRQNRLVFPARRAFARILNHRRLFGNRSGREMKIAR